MYSFHSSAVVTANGYLQPSLPTSVTSLRPPTEPTSTIQYIDVPQTRMEPRVPDINVHFTHAMSIMSRQAQKVFAAVSAV
jgi:hypothetical protein